MFDIKLSLELCRLFWNIREKKFDDDFKRLVGITGDRPIRLF